MGNRTRPIDQHVGERIRLLRTERGLTQEQLAAALEISYQQVQKYETGANRISAGRIYEIARKLAVDVGWFFDGLAAGESTTPPLEHVAKIVRGADTDRLDLAPEAAGLLAISLGLSRTHSDDLAQLDAGMSIYDALYRWARDATDETHTWTSGKTAK